jgi:hypothetical protein
MPRGVVFCLSGMLILLHILPGQAYQLKQYRPTLHYIHLHVAGVDCLLIAAELIWLEGHESSFRAISCDVKSIDEVKGLH